MKLNSEMVEARSIIFQIIKVIVSYLDYFRGRMVL